MRYNELKGGIPFAVALPNVPSVLNADLMTGRSYWGLNVFPERVKLVESDLEQIMGIFNK